MELQIGLLLMLLPSLLAATAGNRKSKFLDAYELVGVSMIITTIAPSEMHVAPLLLSNVDNMPQMLSQTCPRSGYQRLPLDGVVIEF